MYTAKLKLAGVQSELDRYIAAFEENPPKRHRGRSRSWKEPPPEARPDGLGIVTWVQDAGSKVIVQAHYAEVPPTLGAR